MDIWLIFEAFNTLNGPQNFAIVYYETIQQEYMVLRCSHHKGSIDSTMLFAAYMTSLTTLCSPFHFVEPNEAEHWTDISLRFGMVVKSCATDCFLTYI